MNTWHASLVRRLAASIVVLALSLALQLLVANTAAASSLSVGPTSGVPGTSAQVVGGGFPASQSVSLCWDAPNCSSLGTAQSGSNSSFSVAITIPSGAPEGRHLIYACRQGTCASAVFDVLSDTTTTSSTTTTTSTVAPTSTTLPTTTASTVVGGVTTTTVAGRVTTSTTAGSTPTTMPGEATTSTVAGVVTTSTVADGATTTMPGTATTSTVQGGQVFATSTTTPLTDTTTEAGFLAREFAVVGDAGSDPSLPSWFGVDPPMSIDSGAASETPGIAGLRPFDAVEPPAWLRPLAPLGRLPLWGQAAILSAGVAGLFFLVPLAARWLWQLSVDE